MTGRSIVLTCVAAIAGWHLQAQPLGAELAGAQGRAASDHRAISSQEAPASSTTPRLKVPPARPEPTNPIKGYTDTPLVPGTTWHIHDPNRPQPKYVQPQYDGKPVPAPAGADVLFDGKGLDKWRNKNWKLADGAMQVTKGGQQTVDAFGDMRLHIEWLVPEGLPGYCQQQGNSGVYLMGKYEIQVLNCYNNRTYADGMTAAMYGQYPPMVNACRKPGQWQAYDIHFKAPVFEGGKLVQGAYVTVYLNNVLVHDNAKYMGASTWRRAAKYAPHAAKAPFSLQAHGSPVRYRNIWVMPLTKKLGPGAPKSGK